MKTLSLLTLCIAFSAPMLFAQAPYFAVVISTGGTDGANCGTVSQPCRTLNYALLEVNAGGSIQASGPGDYGGGVVISNSVTIDLHGGTLSGAGSNGNCGTFGVCIYTPSPYQVITIKNATILTGTTVSVGFIVPGTSSSATVIHMENVEIQGASGQPNGVQLDSGATTLEHVTVLNIANANVSPAVLVESGARASLSNCFLPHNSYGLQVNSGSIVQVDNTLFQYNAAGIKVASGGTVRLSNSTISDNTTGLALASGASLISFGNNRIYGNTTNGNPTATSAVR